MADGGEKIVVLGCGGFIGSHLVERLLDDGYEVAGMDRTRAKLGHVLGRKGFEYVEGDMADAGTAEEMVERGDAVISLAALCNPSLYNTRPLEVIDINFTHALPVVRACREQGKRLIHFSTCEVYGKSKEGLAGGDGGGVATGALMSEESTPLILGPVNMQRWSYACAKQLLERVIYAEGSGNGLRYSIVRPFNVIGARMDFIPGVDGEGTPRVVPSFMKALMFGETLKLVDGGTSRRSFVSVGDAVDATVRILERAEASTGRIFNVGNPDNEVTMAELARLMINSYEKQTGREAVARTETVSAAEFYGEGYDDCDRRVPDISLAEELLGWRPKTPLGELIDETVGWYVKEYGEKSG